MLFQLRTVKNKSSMIIPLLALTLAAQVVPHIYAQAADQHAVFAMTNSVEGNQIIAYSRAADGSLIERNQIATGGRGSGGTTDPLGSQGSLTLSQDHSLLFAVNAGTGDISVFRVTRKPAAYPGRLLRRQRTRSDRPAWQPGIRNQFRR